jgi:cell volume regulation protein A
VPGSLVGVVFAMSDIADFALIVFLVAGAFALAVLSTKLTDWIPVPPPALFLVGAAVVSDFWPGLYSDASVLTVERIAVIALIVILFNGGMDIGWRRFRVAAGPILSLGILGTFATAGLVAVFAHYALGFDWTFAGLVGAALAPTDPAVMFSVLGRREIGGRAGTTLEGEAGVNDPAGIALMIGMIELATHADESVLVILREFVVEMGIGTALGFAGALLMVALLGRVRLSTEALNPVFALALAFALYGVTGVANGSGFLAVFIAGLVVGATDRPYKSAIEGFHGSLAVLAEIAVFVALGLRVSFGSLTTDQWVDGALLLLALAVLVRPIVVVTSLAGFRFRWSERAFIAWSGLKGAAPFLLAAFAVLADVEDAKKLFGIVFVVVLLSVIGQGTPLPWVARKLAIPMREPSG